MISRREAEDLLMAHTNPHGTFLVRESEQNPGGFALSIKDWDQVTISGNHGPVLKKIQSRHSPQFELCWDVQL
jgi:hypothetical protein